jgi:hypothetical protein
VSPKATANRTTPICLRMPQDLHAAIEQLSAQAGLSTSEWIRDVLYRAIYGEPPGENQGYVNGRQIGYQILMLAFRDASRSVPESAEEAMKVLRTTPPIRAR